MMKNRVNLSYIMMLLTGTGSQIMSPSVFLLENLLKEVSSWTDF